MPAIGDDGTTSLEEPPPPGRPNATGVVFAGSRHAYFGFESGRIGLVIRSTSLLSSLRHSAIDSIFEGMSEGYAALRVDVKGPLREQVGKWNFHSHWMHSEPFHRCT